MSVRNYRKDPRSAAQRKADEEILAQFRRGEVLRADPSLEREAVAYVEQRYQARRALVASLGKELGILRRAHGLSQEQVARTVGTTKSNISRLESGRYGGLTIERFIAVLDAFDALGGQRRES